MGSQGGQQNLITAVRVPVAMTISSNPIADDHIITVTPSMPLVWVYCMTALRAGNSSNGSSQDPQVADHVLKQLFGGFETERGRVADVQFDHTVPFVFKAMRFTQHRAADVITYAFELRIC